MASWIESISGQFQQWEVAPASDRAWIEPSQSEPSSPAGPPVSPSACACEPAGLSRFVLHPAYSGSPSSRSRTFTWLLAFLALRITNTIGDKQEEPEQAREEKDRPQPLVLPETVAQGASALERPLRAEPCSFPGTDPNHR